jgi:hypothetical protein
MKRNLSVLFIVGAAAALAACGGNSPEGACDKYLSFDDKMDADKKAKEKTECVDKLGKFQKEDPERFKLLAQCVNDAKSKDDADQCKRKSKEKPEEKK